MKRFETTNHNYSRWYLVFSVYFFAIHLRFASYKLKTLAGDDIILLGWSNQKNGYMSTIWRSVTDHTLGKWRPIPQVILSPLLDFFGGDFWKYQLLNEALLATCGLLLAVLVTNLSGGKFLLGFSAGSFVILARFNLYHVLQVLGLMETVALIFTLLLLIALEKYARLRVVKFLYFANAFFFAVIHTHERFLFLLPLILFCSFIYTSGEIVKKRCFLISLPLIITVENYWVKTQIFHMTFLTGGGGTVINSSTTDIPNFFWKATLNILGYNSGPDYLSGKDAHALGHSAVYVSLIWSIPLLILIFFACGRIFHNTGLKNTVINSFTAVLLLVPLLLSSSITFRQEYRWLFAPYLALVIVAHTAVAILAKSKRIQILLCSLLIGTGSIVGVYYAKYAESTYFFSTSSLADSINDRIFSQYRDQIPTTTFVIIGIDSTFSWALGDQAVGDQFYYRAYSPDQNFDIRSIASPDLLDTLVDVRENMVLFDYRFNQVVQRTKQ